MFFAFRREINNLSSILKVVLYLHIEGEYFHSDHPGVMLLKASLGPKIAGVNSHRKPLYSVNLADNFCLFSYSMFYSIDNYLYPKS